MYREALSRWSRSGRGLGHLRRRLNLYHNHHHSNRSWFHLFDIFESHESSEFYEMHPVLFSSRSPPLEGQERSKPKPSHRLVIERRAPCQLS